MNTNNYNHNDDLNIKWCIVNKVSMSIMSTSLLDVHVESSSKQGRLIIPTHICPKRIQIKSCFYNKANQAAIMKSLRHCRNCKASIKGSI